MSPPSLDQQVSPIPLSSEQDNEEFGKTPYLNHPLWLQSSIEDRTHFLEDLRDARAKLRETDAFLGNVIEKHSSCLKELREIPDLPSFLLTPDRLPSLNLPPSPINEAPISSFFRKLDGAPPKRSLKHAAMKQTASEEDGNDTTINNFSKPSPHRPKVMLARSKAASTAGHAPASPPTIPTTPTTGRAPGMIAHGMAPVLLRRSRRGQKDSQARESFSTETVLRRRGREDAKPTASTSNPKRRKT